MPNTRWKRLAWGLLPFCANLAVLSAAPAPASASTASYTVASFTGLGIGDDIPGDPNIAVGPTYIVETINTRMAVYTKAGNETGFRPFSDLFAPATNVMCVDPRVAYWAWSNRYAIACSDTGSDQTIRLAVSDTSDPNGSWHTWSTGPNTAVDQTKVVITKDKLVIGGNAPPGSVFWVYQLSDLLSGVAAPRMKFLAVARGQFQAVVEQTGISPAYFVQAYPGGNDLYLAKIGGTPAAGVSLKVTDLGHYPLTPPAEPAIPGGSLGGMDLDGRVTSAVYQTTTSGARIIQFSGMAECGSRVCNANGEITLTSTGPVNSYVKTFSETSWDDTYGALTVDPAGRAFEVYSRSNATTTPQAAVVTPGFKTIVARSGSGTTACPVGATPPCDERWGDYLGATQDPSNHEELWFVGLYQATSGDEGWLSAISSVTVAG